MPANVVKTKRDEKLWERAKKEVEETYGSTDDRWAIVMHIFQNMKKHSKTGNLRERTIRLAHEKPELREHLLPLLTKQANGRSLYHFKFRTGPKRFKDVKYIEELVDVVLGAIEDGDVEAAVYESQEGNPGGADRIYDSWDYRALYDHANNFWTPGVKRLSPKMKAAVQAFEMAGRSIQGFLHDVGFLER